MAGFGGDGLERDFRADAGDVAEGNANPASHIKLRIPNFKLRMKLVTASFPFAI